MTRDEFRKAYTQQKANAKGRGLEMRLSFEEWKDIWTLSGKWASRGKGPGTYCMCRVGDQGHYELGNVFIAENKANVSFAHKGKAKSVEQRERISQAHLGAIREYATGVNNVMHRPEVKAKISAATKGGKHYRAKRLSGPFGEFSSGTEASKATGIPKPTIYWLCKNNKRGWSYLTIA